MNNNNIFANNILEAERKNHYLLPNGSYFNIDSMKTRLNNNVLVIGGSGSLKTRSVVTPNILSSLGSYIVSDPKGSLYRKYKDFFTKKGYSIIHLNFIRPEQSDGYNMFAYIKNSNDVMKLAHYITYAQKDESSVADPFWDRSSQLLLSALIGYVVVSKGSKNSEKNIRTLSSLVMSLDAQKLEDDNHCYLDSLFDKLLIFNKGDILADWSFEQYKKFRQIPPKTLNCIIATLQGNLGFLDTPEINEMMLKPTIDFVSLASKKTIVFVEVSDTDRSKDILINTFYTQAMNELCSYADEACTNSALPLHVRFILDDFGTNCKIENFENIISNIRSRNISSLVVIQSESQLKKSYKESAHTIMDNCDTTIYLGGNDVNTARTISIRANKSISSILNMPVGTNWIFRRGEKPVFSRTVDLDEYKIFNRDFWDIVQTKYNKK